MRRTRAAAVVALALSLVVAGNSGASAAPGDPAPGTPEYLARDAQNIADAYGRQTAADGQRSPAYGLARAPYLNPGLAARHPVPPSRSPAPAPPPEPARAQPRHGGARVEQRQPVPEGLGRHPGS